MLKFALAEESAAKVTVPSCNLTVTTLDSCCYRVVIILVILDCNMFGPLLQIRHDEIVVFECGLKGRVPLISESGFATVDLGAVKDASIGACSRGCMVIHGGVCCHAIAFSLAAKKNIMDYINPRDTTMYWQSQYEGVFKIPTSKEYPHIRTVNQTFVRFLSGKQVRPYWYMIDHDPCCTKEWRCSKF